jgi:hypothetical protein
MNQPVLKFMLSLMVRPNITIVVLEGSRISRNMEKGMKLIEALHKRGCNLVMSNCMADSKNAIYGLPAIKLSFTEGQIYSDNISNKVQASVATRRAAGQVIGKPSFGFTTSADRMRVVPNWDEIAVIRLIQFLASSKIKDNQVVSIYQKFRNERPRGIYIRDLYYYTRNPEFIAKLLKDNRILLRNRMTKSTVETVIRELKNSESNLNSQLRA